MYIYIVFFLNYSFSFITSIKSGYITHYVLLIVYLHKLPNLTCTLGNIGIQNSICIYYNINLLHLLVQEKSTFLDHLKDLQLE
jgi:hypothetical protein